LTWRCFRPCELIRTSETYVEPNPAFVRLQDPCMRFFGKTGAPKAGPLTQGPGGLPGRRTQYRRLVRDGGTAAVHAADGHPGCAADDGSQVVVDRGQGSSDGYFVIAGPDHGKVVGVASPASRIPARKAKAVRSLQESLDTP